MKIFITAIFMIAPILAHGEGKVLSQPNGRFAFGQISDARRDQFMLDTATGRLWQVVCAKVDNKKTGMDQCDVTTLVPVTYSWGGQTYNIMPPPIPLNRQQ
jgi:hypothetical protein